MKRIMCSTLGVAALESSSSSVSAIWEQFVHKFLKTFLVVKKKKKKSWQIHCTYAFPSTLVGICARSRSNSRLLKAIKAMVSSVVMYGCESWTIKKAEHQRIDAFKLWCWKRPLSIPWTARRSSQLILKEVSPEYSLEGLMLKLKLQQYFGHLMWRTDSLEKDPYGGKDWRQEEKGQQRMRGLDGITNSRHKFEQDPGVGDGQGSLVCCSPWGRRVGHNWGAKLNWTALILAFKITSNSTCGANLFVLIWFFS